MAAPTRRLRWPWLLGVVAMVALELWVFSHNTGVGQCVDYATPADGSSRCTSSPSIPTPLLWTLAIVGLVGIIGFGLLALRRPPRGDELVAEA